MWEGSQFSIPCPAFSTVFIFKWGKGEIERCVGKLLLLSHFSCVRLFVLEKCFKPSHLGYNSYQKLGNNYFQYEQDIYGEFFILSKAHTGYYLRGLLSFLTMWLLTEPFYSQHAQSWAWVLLTCILNSCFWSQLWDSLNYHTPRLNFHTCYKSNTLQSWKLLGRVVDQWCIYLYKFSDNFNFIEH